MLCGYVCTQVWYAMQVSVRNAMYAMRDGQAGRSADAGMCYANMRYVIRNADSTKIKANCGKNVAKRAENRGIVDILYDGFRKCFVNCKFTFYITLSSYLKKLKIRKTSKSHSKM